MKLFESLAIGVLREGALPVLLLVRAKFVYVVYASLLIVAGLTAGSALSTHTGSFVEGFAMQHKLPFATASRLHTAGDLLSWLVSAPFIIIAATHPARLFFIYERTPILAILKELITTVRLAVAGLVLALFRLSIGIIPIFAAFLAYDVLQQRFPPSFTVIYSVLMFVALGAFLLKLAPYAAIPFVSIISHYEPRIAATICPRVARKHPYRLCAAVLLLCLLYLGAWWLVRTLAIPFPYPLILVGLISWYFVTVIAGVLTFAVFEVEEELAGRVIPNNQTVAYSFRKASALRQKKQQQHDSPNSGGESASSIQATTSATKNDESP